MSVRIHTKGMQIQAVPQACSIMLQEQLGNVSAGISSRLFPAFIFSVVNVTYPFE